jgi:hypothetical protein
MNSTVNANLNGYDYKNQAWVVRGRYFPCGHNNAVDPMAPIQTSVSCGCYGTIHAHEPVPADVEVSGGYDRRGIRR